MCVVVDLCVASNNIYVFNFVRITVQQSKGSRGESPSLIESQAHVAGHAKLPNQCFKTNLEEY